LGKWKISMHASHRGLIRMPIRSEMKGESLEF
jgi:hypothetical protein